MTGLPVVQEDILHLFSPETMTLATAGFSYLQKNNNLTSFTEPVHFVTNA